VQAEQSRGEYAEGCLVWEDRQIKDCDSVAARRVPRLPGREAASMHLEMLRQRQVPSKDKVGRWVGGKRRD